MHPLLTALVVFGCTSWRAASPTELVGRYLSSCATASDGDVLECLVIWPSFHTCSTCIEPHFLLLRLLLTPLVSSASKVLSRKSGVRTDDSLLIQQTFHRKINNLLHDLRRAG